MSRLAVSILFALCISQYASAAVVSSTITDVKQLKSEIETVVKVLKVYTENYLYELYEAQDVAKKEYETGLNKEIDAIFDEIKNAAQKVSAKANQCVVAAKAKLDNLKTITPKIVEDCIESQEEEEVQNLFDKLLDEISAGKKIGSLIESLEKDSEASNGRDANVEKKIPGVRASVDLLEGATDDLMENGGKIMTNVENQSKVCVNKQLVDVHSSAVAIKENAFHCISQA